MVMALAAALAWINTLAAISNCGTIYLICTSIAVVVCLALARAKPGIWWLAGIPITFYICAHLRSAAPDGFDLARYSGESVKFKAEVLEAIDQGQYKRTLLIVHPTKLLYPQTASLSGKAQVIVRPVISGILRPGDFTEIEARLQSPKDPPNPWNFPQKAHLAQESIFCVATTSAKRLRRLEEATTSTLGPQCLSNWISTSRQKITDLHLSTLGQNDGALLESIVLGNRCIDLPPDLVEKYRKVGLSHLLAASGFNLTIVIMVAHWLAKLISPSRVFCAIASLLPMLIFVLLAGFSPSVVRAATSSLICLCALQAGRALNQIAVLASALMIMLLIDPSCAADIGAQLSYAATFGILAGAAPLSAIAASRLDRLKRLGLPPLTEKLLRWLTEASAVVLSAQAAVLPIQLLYFWRLGTMFLPASVLVDPLVAPITIIGFASSTLALFPFYESMPVTKLFCQMLDYLALIPIKVLDAVASFFAAATDSYINLGPPSLSLIFLYYVALLGLITAIRKRHRLFLCTFLFGISTFAMLYRLPLSKPTLLVRRHSLVAVGTDRQAIVVGQQDNASGKFLAYEGAKVLGRIENWDGNAGPLSYSLADHGSQVRIVMVTPGQVSNFSGLPISKRLRSSKANCPKLITVLLICNTAMGNAEGQIDKRRNRSRSGTVTSLLPMGLLSKWQEQTDADYTLVLQSGSARNHGNEMAASSESAETNSSSELSERVSIYFEQGTHADAIDTKVAGQASDL